MPRRVGQPPPLTAKTPPPPPQPPGPDPQSQALIDSLVLRIEQLERRIPPPQQPTTLDQLFSLTDHTQISQILQKKLADAPLSTHLQFASLAAFGPVGLPGKRGVLRAVAVTLLDGIIESGDSSDPVVADAMCLKGELLLPYVYYGKNVAHVPRSVLQEAYTLFERAASPLGTFLKGRWLLSMEPLHKDASEAEIGRQCVKNAAEEGCARALVFLAHRYEYPELDRGVSFAGDVPKGKVARENFILGLYLKAAELGDPDALNDVGTSYAEGYGQVVCDFDRAVDYYVRAINMGSLHAFDNLGTHYETGMGGRCPDRVDFEKALFYYRMGVESRCPKCAYNLGAAHEEGMQAVLQKDLVLAERFYNLSILLADDCNDLQTAVKSLKDLTALLVTRIKMGNPDDAEVERMKGELVGLNKGEERAGRLWARIHKAIGQAVKGRTAGLTELLGDENARMIVDRVKKEKDRDLANYLLGPEGVAVVEGGAKKKKERPKRAAKKRRK